MDNQSRNQVSVKLVKAFLSNLSATPSKRRHLLISAFLAVKSEDENEMTAFKSFIEEKFKELILAKEGKYKDKIFNETLGKLLYTHQSAEQRNDPDYQLLSQISNIDNEFTHETIFVLLDEEGKPIFGDSAKAIIDNDMVPNHFMSDALDSKYVAPDHRDLYGKNLIIRVAEPIYGILKALEENYNFEKCLKYCKENPKRSKNN